MAAEPEDLVPSFVLCKSYNVILVGDSRVGKSTFIQLLQQPLIKSIMSLYRGTIEPEVKTLFLNTTIDNEEYNIVLNILDTPGLNEKPEKGTPRHNDELKFMISNHIKSHFSELDLILITLKCSGITQGVVDTFFQIKEYFGNKYLPNMCLLFTHCDEMSQKEEDCFKDMLKQNPVVLQFLNAIQNRIIFTGRNTEHPKTTSDIDFLAQQQRRKKVFLKYLMSSPKMNLKTATVLTDLRPIDILESASVTNELILYQGHKNKELYEEICGIIVILQSLVLSETDAEKRDKLTAQFSAHLNTIKLCDSNDDDKIMAQKYTEVEIPLKIKANELRQQNHFLQQQLTSIKSAHDVYSLRVIKQPKTQETTKPSEFEMEGYF